MSEAGFYSDKRETEFIKIFKDKNIQSANYVRTHFFEDKDEKQLSNVLKNELFVLFDVTSKKDLAQKLKGEWTLVIKDGDKKTEVNYQNKEVIIYCSKYEEKVEQKKKAERIVRGAKKLADSNKAPTSSEVVNMLEEIDNKIQNVNFLEKQRQRITEIVPNIIKKLKLKLKLYDVTDINKTKIKEILEIGYGILNKEAKYHRVLGISPEQIKDELAWQKYFELYGDYLLFGSVESKALQKLKKEFHGGYTDSEPDLITLNRYGFIDVVELKKSDVDLFKLDDSHNIYTPTDALQKAINQLNHYLMIITRSVDVNDADMKGAESSSGILVIGSKKSLMSDKNKIKCMQKYGIPTGKIEIDLLKSLRELNYSLAHIKVILYDELLENLEKFTENMKIEKK